MIIGVLKETRKFENRVALSVDMVKKLVGQGHEVLVEQGAGLLSSIVDKDYESVGASIKSRDQIFTADLILMVRPFEDDDIDLFKIKSYFSGNARAF